MVVPKTKIRLNILVEHPKSSWKRIGVKLNYNPVLAMIPSEREITDKNDVGMSSLTEEVMAPNKLGEFPMGEVVITIDGDERSQYLPTMRVLSEDGYFEEMVAEKLRKLEFEAVRLGGPSKPDVEAAPKKDPSQKVQLEATLEDSYEISKFRNDVSKFREWRRIRQYKRLLIVPYSNTITDGVARELKRAHDPVSLIKFKDLEKLAADFEQGLLSIYQVQWILLGHTGIIHLESLT